jgi:NAD(P)-dependent dehydrogenase (short-subunit alcohol dehydrogenase family)
MKRPITLLSLVALTAANSCFAATILVTGSDRGLGLEFVRQYAARGDTVIATCRHPDKAAELQALAAGNKRVLIEALDVARDDQIMALAARYKGRPIDILINNAGVLGARDEQSLGTFKRQAFHDVMDVNSFGPLAVSQALRENVMASSQKKIIAITSGLGSISWAGGMPRGPYYYRMSKAALNMGMRALGADLKSQGAVVAVVAPGVAETAMVTAYRHDYGLGNYTTLSAAESVSKMIAIIDKLDQSQAERGSYWIDGSIVPW